MYDEDMARRVGEALAETAKLVNITPYRELGYGEDAESIYDHIVPDQVVPDTVVEYLKLGDVDWLCPGIYPHPFVEGEQLAGPNSLKDGIYTWEGYTWLYASKYHVELPSAFIEHVLSEEGQVWLERRRVEETERLEEVRRLRQQRMDDNEPGLGTLHIARKVLDVSLKELSHTPIGETDGWWHFRDNASGRHAVVSDFAEALAVPADISFEELFARFEAGERSKVPGLRKVVL